MGQRKRQMIWGAVTGVIGALSVLVVLGLHHAATLHTQPPTSPKPPAARPLSGVVVVLDPGHGGADPGATAGPISEAALSYRTACELAAQLKDAGAEVVYTVRSRRLDPALAVAEPPLMRPADAVLALNGQPMPCWP